MAYAVRADPYLHIPVDTFVFVGRADERDHLVAGRRFLHVVCEMEL